MKALASLINPGLVIERPPGIVNDKVAVARNVLSFSLTTNASGLVFVELVPALWTCASGSSIFGFGVASTDYSPSTGLIGTAATPLTIQTNANTFIKKL